MAQFDSTTCGVHLNNAKDDIARLCKDTRDRKIVCIFTDVFGNGPKCSKVFRLKTFWKKSCRCKSFWSQVDEIVNKVSEADKASLKATLLQYLSFQKPLE